MLQAGSAGSWTPIGVAATATGYEVAWKLPGADEYTVWSTDSSGNYTSDTERDCRETVSRWNRWRTSFHQDLNGDGMIGIPPQW